MCSSIVHFHLSYVDFNCVVAYQVVNKDRGNLPLSINS